MALDTAQILQQLNMFYISALDDIVNAYLPPQATNADSFQVPMVYYPSSLFLEGLMPQQRSQNSTGDTDTIDNDQFIRSPYQFIRNVFRALLLPVDWENKDATQSSDSANKLPKSASSAPGKNFFARYIAFHDLYRRFVGLPYIDKDMVNGQAGCFPIIKACQDTEVTQAIQSQLGAAVGPSGTVWDLLNMVLGTMFMEVATIPAPPIGMAEIDSGVMVDLFLGKRNSDDKKYAGVIASHMIKPQCYFGLPPTCNVIFPSMVQSLSLEENYLPQPTRVYLGEQFLANLIAGKANASSAQLTTSTLTKGYPPVVDARMSQFMLAQYENTKNFLIYPEEFYRGPVSRQVNAPPWLYLLEQFYKSLRQGSGGGGGGGGTTFGSGSKGQIAFVKYITPSVIKFCKGEGTTGLGVPPDYVWVRMYKESGYGTNTSASNVKHSSTGAIGLMQIQPPRKKVKDPVTGKTTMVLVPGGEKMTRVKQQLRDRFPSVFGGKKDDEIDLQDPATSVAAGVSHIYDDMIAAEATPKDMTRDAFIYSENAPITKGSLVLFAYAYGSPTAKKQWIKVKAGKYKTMGEFAKVWGEHGKNTMGYKKLLERFIEGWDKSQAIRNAAASAQPQAPAATAPAGPASEQAVPEENWGTYQSGDVPDSPAGTNPPAPATPEQPQAAPVGPVSETAAVPEGGWTEDQSDSQSADVVQEQKLALLEATQIQMKAAEVDSLGNLFRLYAQYEYNRARYESRIGAAVLAFNPYIVPAFPAVMFDSKYSGISTFGYILNVTHQMSAAAGGPNMTTTVNSAFQRTISEAMANERQGWDDSVWGQDASPMVYDTYPAEAIPDVARIFQSVEYANAFYGKVFYQKKMDVPIPETGDEEAYGESDTKKENYAEAYYTDEAKAQKKQTKRDAKAATKRRDRMMRTKGVSSVFNFRKIVDIVRLGEDGREEHNVPSWAYNENMEIRPSAAYTEQFRSYDAAMSYVARPVCTLKQYIELRHGMSLEAAIKKGYVAGEEPSFYSSLTAGTSKVGAKFWARIFYLRQGPGDPKVDEIYKFANCGAAEDNYPPISPNWDELKLSSGIPQTRHDWDKILTDYRDMVRAKDSTGGAPRR